MHADIAFERAGSAARSCAKAACWMAPFSMRAMRSTPEI
jgi:hypothetical protein